LFLLTTQSQVLGDHRRLLLMCCGAAVVIVGLFAVFLSKKLPKDRIQPSPVLVSMSVHTSPPGAKIIIDGLMRGVSDLQLDFLPGRHTITAQLEGFQPLTQEVNSDDRR